MTKTELKVIMNNNSIFGNTWEDAIYFVQDLLEFQAKELEETEPYATNSIRRLKDAAHEVWNLQGYVGDVLEND